MRLLLLTPEYSAWGGGIATFYRDFVRQAAEQDVDVRVIEGSAFAMAPERNRTAAHGVTTEQLETGRFLRWFESFGHLSAVPTFRRHLAAAWAMWEQALEGPDFDIVEATDWGLLSVPAVVANSHPTIIQAHASCGQIASYDVVPGQATSDILMRMAEITAFNAATEVQTYATANGRFWEAEVARTVSVLRPAWSPPPKPAASSISDTGLVVGRLQSWKGPETLCHALQLTGSGGSTVHWIGREVAWPSTDLPASAHLAQRYPEIWGARVIHEKPQTPDQVRRRQSAALFNLVPSTWDVFNFTAVEAMTSGRPTIISSGAGASELVEHGINGFVFPAGDAAALAQVIEHVQSLPPARQAEIGGNGYETVARELDATRVTRRRIEAYRAAVSNHAIGARSIPSWLKHACSPSASPEPEGQFLRHLPVRMLTKHILQRVLKRTTFS